MVRYVSSFSSAIVPKKNVLLNHPFRSSVVIGLYVCLVISTTILTAIHAHDRDALLNAKRGAIIVRREGERRSARRMLLGPWLLLKTMLYDPVTRLDSKSLSATYSIDIKENYDFFVVTVSRLCYYCGVSIQTVRGCEWTVNNLKSIG